MVLLFAAVKIFRCWCAWIVVEAQEAEACRDSHVTYPTGMPKSKMAVATKQNQQKPISFIYQVNNIYKL